jgi:hypothetical protein
MEANAAPLRLSSRPCVLPIPRVQDPRRFTIERWYDLYADTIEEMFNDLVSKIESIRVLNHGCVVNRDNLHRDFVRFLYKTSNSAYRTFPR